MPCAHKPHPTHLSVAQALEVAARVRAERNLFHPHRPRTAAIGRSRAAGRRSHRLRRVEACILNERCAIFFVSSLSRFALCELVPRKPEQSLAQRPSSFTTRPFPSRSQLAKFYAQQRGIPRDHLIGLACSTEEEISREEYDTTIAEPLREDFQGAANGGRCARTRRTDEVTVAVHSISSR